MFRLIQKKFNPDDIIADGTRFLIGNGHIGFRGVAEEFSKNEFVGLNIVGAYDQYQDKWRESLNAPNPFHVELSFNDENLSILNSPYETHRYELNLKHAIMKRITTFKPLTVISKKFLDVNEIEHGQMMYQIKAHQSGEVKVFFSIDTDVWDINGPHFTPKEIGLTPYLHFLGQTNEGEYLSISTYVHSKQRFHGVRQYLDNKITKGYVFNAEAGKIYRFIVVFDVRFGSINVGHLSLEGLDHYRRKGLINAYKNHQKTWEERWQKSDVIIDGNRKADFALRYSLYHLWILAPTKYLTSIPARGLSGQTYKGAIFWDTEIFIEPFFTLVEPAITRKLIQYRIEALTGAKEKAKRFGYQGAFYAWESQEEGREACSLYNVTDALTGEPVRTYFADKQIHISGDVGLSIIRYVELTGDTTILEEGGLVVLLEIIKFYLSYASKDQKTGQYHLNDVIGPDEYHERINDNAFTNYLVYELIEKTLSLVSDSLFLGTSKFSQILTSIDGINLEQISDFVENLYLPKPNKMGIYEQFKGYFLLEDISLNDLKKRLKVANEYWGGEHGIATPTKIIKQADVITMMALFPNRFTDLEKQQNFDYYEPKTEHGSSLSACMYSLQACAINRSDFAYHFFLKSALIDLVGGEKKYAGSIYIGGSHPASSGGSYLCAIYGFAGLIINENQFDFIPRLPKKIRGMHFKIFIRGKRYLIHITHEGVIKEQIYD